ncbi:MAG: hypothetical protein Q9165_002608 [Trypethelium subeluteriae]
MSGIDVEALLESAEDASRHNSATLSAERDGGAQDERAERRDRDRERRRDDSRDRDRDRIRRDRSRNRGRNSRDGGEDMSDRGSTTGSHKNRRRSRSRDGGYRRRDRYRDSLDFDDAYKDSGGDYYRGGGRARSRSRSPHDDRYYRPTGRSRRDHDDDTRERRRDGDRRDRDRGGRDREHGKRRSPSQRRRSHTPPPTEDERDRRTVFVQQLAARLRSRELRAFFEKVGTVIDAQIVKDRVSGRSKGVGYVEFKDEESVPKAIQLTGQQLLGIPIIAQLTEAEKNRQARTSTVSGNAHANGVPFHRLYVGNIHFSITESDLQNIFEPFGELEFVQLQKEDQGRSRGYGFVQFRDPAAAKEALEKMNGFDLAGRPIRVGLGNDKFTPESTQDLLQRFPNQANGFQGSAFSGSGGRGTQAGGSSNFDRAGGRGDDKGAGGASALDDTDVAGVNFSNYSRDALMRKLARADEPAESSGADRRSTTRPRNERTTLPVNVPQYSRCVLLRNMFDPEDYKGQDTTTWKKELEDEVKEECSDKYGKVVHIAAQENDAGEVYLKFQTVTGGENAVKGLNGRFFGGRTISAQPVVDAVYSSMFARTRSL